MYTSKKPIEFSSLNQSNPSKVGPAPEKRKLVDFPPVETQCSSDRSLGAKILEDTETNFTSLRILNRCFPIWQPNCRVRIGEQVFDADSRFLAKLSPQLKAIVTAAELASKTQTIIHLSEISPEAMEFLISFLSGETDFPDLWQGHDLKLFQEIVSFAVRWQSCTLLAFCDAHAVKCLTQSHSARDTFASGVAALIRSAASIPIICNFIPSKLRNHQELVRKDNLKLAFWATYHRKPLQKLLSALPSFQRTVAEQGSSIASDVSKKNIRLIPTSNNLWPFLNCENSSLDEQGFHLSGDMIGEPQRDNERRYLDCAQRILRGQPISEVLNAQEETFLVGLLLHSIRQAPLNLDFASLTIDLFKYLRDLFIKGSLSRPSAFFLCHLADQNPPVYASLLSEQKLVLEAQKTIFTSLRSHLNDVDISAEKVWTPRLLTQRARAASKWTATDWERTALVNHWQLFCALLNEDHVSFGTIEECHRLLKKRLEVAVLQDDCPKWAQHAHQQLTSLLNVLTWLGETEQVYDHVEVIEGCKTIELSLFQVLLHGSYTSKFRQYEPQSCVRWTSQNLDQLPVVVHVLENGTLPEYIVLSELDWDSLVLDLDFLDCRDLIPKIKANLCKKVNLTNVVDYFNFAINNDDLLVLQKACIDVLNTGGFVKIIPHETGPWELKELAGIDRMPLAQKEMVFTLLREHEWDTSIETWRSENKLFFQKAIFWNQTAQTVAELALASLAASILVATTLGTSFPLFKNYFCDTEAPTAELCRIFRITTLLSAIMSGLAGGFLTTMFGSRYSANLANRVIPLTSRHRPNTLIIRGPELRHLPTVSAPKFASNLVYTLDKSTQVLDLTQCSDQLTPQDIAWIAQNCSQLTELRIGITKLIYGDDWKPLTKLSKLRKFALVFSSPNICNFRFINSLDLSELKSNWPNLEEIQVTLQKGLQPDASGQADLLNSMREGGADLSFFDNCPHGVPLRLTIQTSYHRNNLSKVFTHCHSLKILDGHNLYLSKNSIRAITKNCHQLSELKRVQTSGKGLVELAKHCNLTHIESCESDTLNNEDVQQLVRHRESRLKVVSGLFPELTSVGYNTFASCPQLEHLALSASLLINEEFIQDLLNAPQIRRLSLSLGAGISVETQRRLARRWLKNVCPKKVEELWCELDSILSPTYGNLSLLRPFVPFFSFITQIKNGKDLVVGQGNNNPKNIPIEIPVAPLLSLANVELKDLNHLLNIRQIKNWLRELFDVAGGYSSVILQLALQRLASSETLTAIRTEMLQSYFRYLSLSNHTLTHEQIDTLTKQWTQTAGTILEQYTELIQPEIGRFLYCTVDQFSNWGRRFVEGPEQHAALLSELFPMTLRYAEEVHRSLLKAIENTSSSNPRLSRTKRKLEESLQVAKQDMRERKLAIEGLQQRRDERLAALRNVDGTLPEEHERQRLESEGIEEQMIASLRSKIHQLQEQLTELDEDSDVDENGTALLLGMFLQPQFWTLVNQTLEGFLNLSVDE